MTTSIRNILQQHPQFKIKEKFNFFRKYSTVPEALRSHVSIFWFNSWLFNGCCLWDILISMSKLSSSRASFLCHDLTHFWESTFNNSFCMRNYNVYRQQTSNVWKNSWYYTIFEKILESYRIFHFSYYAFNFNLKFPIKISL